MAELNATGVWALLMLAAVIFIPLFGLSQIGDWWERRQQAKATLASHDDEEVKP